MALADRTQSLTSQSILLMAGRGLGFVVAFSAPIVLVRLLTQAEFGTYKQFFLIAGTLLSLLDFGLAASLFYFIPKDPQRAGNYLRQTALVSFIVGSVVAGVLWFMRDPFATWLNSPLLGTLMPFLAVYLMFEIVGQLLESVVVLEKQAKLAAVLFAGSDSVRVMSLLVPATLTGDLRWVAAGASGYAALRFTALVAWSWWQYRARMQRGRLLYEFGSHVGYALPFGAGGVLHHGLNTYHSFYIAATFSPAIYAVYAVGCQQIAPVSIFFRSLFEVTLVRMTEHAKARRLDAMRELWRKLIAKQAVLLVPLFVAMWLLAAAFIEALFTADYLDAVPIFRVYLLLLPLIMLNDHAVLRACARTGFIFVANTAAVVVSLILVPILVTRFALVGAVAGFVGGMAVMKILGLGKVAALLNVPFHDLLPWRALAKTFAASLITAVLVYPLQQFFTLAIARFFVCGAIFWVIYFAVAWVGNVFGPDEKRFIAQLGQRIGVVPGSLR
jgi:O-antigen/teichoic acid export membrane protein